MAFVRRFPGRNLHNLKDDIDRFYDEFFGPRSEDSESIGKISPRVNIEETNNELVLSVELPGMDREDVKITYKDGNISIMGEKKEEKDVKDRNFHRYEHNYGSFCRTFSVPNQIKSDKIDASFKNGILSITLPKAEETKPQEIEIKVK